MILAGSFDCSPCAPDAHSRLGQKRGGRWRASSSRDGRHGGRGDQGWDLERHWWGRGRHIVKNELREAMAATGEILDTPRSGQRPRPEACLEPFGHSAVEIGHFGDVARQQCQRAAGETTVAPALLATARRASERAARTPAPIRPIRTDPVTDPATDPL